MDPVVCDVNVIMNAYKPHNEVIYYDKNQESFSSCTIDNMKTRWDFLADDGFQIKDIISFYHKSKQYVHMVINLPDRKTVYMKSYIIPMDVWLLRSKEIVTYFK